MAQRGRKGSKGKVVGIDASRPEPPENLTLEQTAAWQQITAVLPADYVRGDTQPLMVSYVKHISYAALIDRQIDAFDPDWLKDDAGLKRFNRLLAMRERQTSVILSLARSLRLTNQSRYTPQRAATATQKNHSNPKPWET